MQCVNCGKTGDGGFGGWEAYGDGVACPECYEALNAPPPPPPVIIRNLDLPAERKA